MTPEELAAGLAALDRWAEPQIAAANVFERSAIRNYIQANRTTIVEVIGTAILAARTKEEST